MAEIQIGVMLTGWQLALVRELVADRLDLAERALDDLADNRPLRVYLADRHLSLRRLQTLLASVP